jgi:uncharacterized coiled-coil DUF342 family protein
MSAEIKKIVLLTKKLKAVNSEIKKENKHIQSLTSRPSASLDLLKNSNAKVVRLTQEAQAIENEIKKVNGKLPHPVNVFI